MAATRFFYPWTSFDFTTSSSTDDDSYCLSFQENLQILPQKRPCSLTVSSLNSISTKSGQLKCYRLLDRPARTRPSFQSSSAIVVDQCEICANSVQKFARIYLWAHICEIASFADLWGECCFEDFHHDQSCSKEILGAIGMLIATLPKMKACLRLDS